ncbi:MAG: adenosylmethionine--8-amino-7-oxononanoate transaminase [Verrucomicrobia bacterium]|nr:adenosylmethionine--8-amino-7-oxononanoate transaminase [Verrucomicrobiota bacterium]
MTDYDHIVELNKRCVWQPFTPMGDWLASDPIVIESARGAVLRDVNGREYLDGFSSMWVNVLGHGRAEIRRALVEQLDKVAHSTMLGLASVPSALLAERLVAITPQSLTRVFFSDDGSTAMEVALKLALQYAQIVEPAGGRTTFISLEHGYHGDTVGAMSLGHVPEFNAAFPSIMFESARIPSPGDDLDAALASADAVLDEHAGHACAVVMEPLIQMAGGFVVHPKGYLAGIAALCRKYGLLLILDEVATGFGRTGTMFACEQEGVEPDIMAIAKGLTNGTMPLAATLTSDKIFGAFVGDARPVFFHGHSYTGNQLGCAAALATLEVFERERVIDNLQPKIRLMGELLDEFRGMKRVGAAPPGHGVRQCGFIGVVELRGESDAYSYAEAIGRRVCDAVRKDGILLRPLGNILYFMPPYCITDGQLRHLIRSTRTAIESLD